jgi:hypothetical protein
MLKTNNLTLAANLPLRDNTQACAIMRNTTDLDAL